MEPFSVHTSEFCCRVTRLHYLINASVITLFTLQINNILSLLKSHHQVHTYCDVTEESARIFTHVQVPHTTQTTSTNKAYLLKLYLLLYCSQSRPGLCCFVLLLIRSTGNTINLVSSKLL